MNQGRETVQPIRRLYDGLSSLATPERYLFTPSDMRALVPDISAEAYRALLSRAARDGKLERICRGLYFYRPAKPTTGLLLFHAAARLRAHEFNYISLETALSDAGIISQIPMNWITLMSSGRSSPDQMWLVGHHRIRSHRTENRDTLGATRLRQQVPDVASQARTGHP
ncbi:hypothetical protein OMD46_01005 [Pseudomonas sp. MDMC_285]|nr:hypothetical protein [Pseudomonas sp. MDMC_285]